MELYPQPSYCIFILGQGVSLNCPSWPQICHPPASTSQVTRITGTRHMPRASPPHPRQPPSAQFQWEAEGSNWDLSGFLLRHPFTAARSQAHRGEESQGQVRPSASLPSWGPNSSQSTLPSMHKSPRAPSAGRPPRDTSWETQTQLPNFQIMWPPAEAPPGPVTYPKPQCPHLPSSSRGFSET